MLNKDCGLKELSNITEDLHFCWGLKKKIYSILMSAHCYLGLETSENKAAFCLGSNHSNIHFSMKNSS